MYITYEQLQLSQETRARKAQNARVNFSSLTKLNSNSGFKPAYLVRTLDMEVVPGSQVHEQYCALSYSWNQSGTIIYKQGEEPGRIDEGLHQVITYKNEKRFVKFSDLVRQICSDFGVRYIWFDQMCIDQENPTKKMQEIRRMHLIYKHAYCTLALVPELERGPTYSWSYEINLNMLPNAQWNKRVWTLEEAYMSDKILLIGRNVHFLSESTPSSTVTEKHSVFLYNMGDKSVTWSASTALFHAKKRTSTKAHDRVFALVNMFPDVLKSIDLDYNRPILDLTLSFYARLIATDLSVLLFGTVGVRLRNSIRADLSQSWEESLPSWTGVRGVHIPQPWFKGKLSCKAGISTRSYGATKHFLLHIVSSSVIHVRIETSKSVQADSRHIGSQGFTKDGMPLRPQKSNHTIAFEENTKDLVFVTVPIEIDYTGYHHETMKYGLEATHFLPVKEGDVDSTNTISSPTAVGGWLSLTEECSECFILSGIAYDLQGGHVAMPVVTKYEGDNCYRSIGICIFENFSHPSFEREKHHFVIK